MNDTATFPVETRVESARTYAARIEFYFESAAKARARGDYEQEQIFLDIAADNLEAAAKQVRGAIAQSKTDADYASRKV